MEVPVTVSSKLEHRAVIHYLTACGKSASTIYRQLAEVYDNAVTYDVVKKWCPSFLKGRTSLADDEHSGRPSVITEDALNMVQALIDGLLLQKWNGTSTILFVIPFRMEQSSKLSKTG